MKNVRARLIRSKVALMLLGNVYNTGGPNSTRSVVGAGLHVNPYHITVLEVEHLLSFV